MMDLRQARSERQIRSTGGQETKISTGTDPNIFLSTLPATRRDRAAAMVVVGLSTLLFALVLPYAGVPLPQVRAFIASYQSALAVNDLITAVLLFSQFAVLRSRALLLLASRYLFTAPIALVHALTFPGLFAPTGLLGAGPQTTAWLYMIGHGVFPLCVLGYALSKGETGARMKHRPAIAIFTCVSVVDAGHRGNHVASGREA